MESHHIEGPRVDAVVVAYNGGDCLVRAVEALLASRGVQPHVIVVDNASEHSAFEQLPIDGCTFIQLGQNAGYGAALNAGVGAATAPWVALCNQDILPDTDCLQTMIRTAQLHKTDEDRAVVIGPNIVDINGDSTETCHRLPSFASQFVAFLFGERFGRRNVVTLSERHTSARQCGWVSAVMLLTDRASFFRTGGFDPGYFMYLEDVDFFRRLADIDGRCIWDPSACVMHVGGVGQSSRRVVSAPLYALAVLNWGRYFRRHGRSLARLQAEVVVMAGAIGSTIRGALWGSRYLLLRLRPSRSSPDHEAERRFASEMTAMFLMGGFLILRSVVSRRIPTAISRLSPAIPT